MLASAGIRLAIDKLLEFSLVAATKQQQPHPLLPRRDTNPPLHGTCLAGTHRKTRPLEKETEKLRDPQGPSHPQMLSLLLLLFLLMLMSEGGPQGPPHPQDPGMGPQMNPGQRPPLKHKRPTETGGPHQGKQGNGNWEGPLKDRREGGPPPWQAAATTNQCGGPASEERKEKAKEKNRGNEKKS